MTPATTVPDIALDAARAAMASRRERARVARSERLVVISLLAFGAAVVILGSMRVAGEVREGRALEAMVETFARVGERQDEFRRLNARFATLPELNARGFRLPSRHQVQRSSADPSHWFLSIRDRNTGMICDRIGELTDEPGTQRKPLCRGGITQNARRRPGGERLTQTASRTRTSATAGRTSPAAGGE
jgi:hypothetical protein